MKLTLLPILALCLASVSPLCANNSTVTYSAQEKGGALGSVGGLDLPAGSLVRLGYFNPAVDVAANFANLSLLNSNFTELTSTYVGYFVDGPGIVVNNNIPGMFVGSVTLDATALNIATVRMYIWAFDASAVGGASAHAIFSDSTWTIGSAPTPLFDVSAVRPGDVGDIYLAQLGPELSASINGTELNKLLPIPEPSALLLGMLSLGGLALTRRRRL